MYTSLLFQTNCHDDINSPLLDVSVIHAAVWTPINYLFIYHAAVLLCQNIGQVLIDPTVPFDT